MTKDLIRKSVLWYQVAAAAAVVAVIWADEALDIPHRLFGAPVTPLNWRECLVESVCVLLLLGLSLHLSRKFLARIRYLEGLLPICSFCKKIRAGDDWVAPEEYVSRHSAADFTHGLCPECKEEHYGSYLSGRRA